MGRETRASPCLSAQASSAQPGRPARERRESGAAEQGTWRAIPFIAAVVVTAVMIVLVFALSASSHTPGGVSPGESVCALVASGVRRAMAGWLGLAWRG